MAAADSVVSSKVDLKYEAAALFMVSSTPKQQASEMILGKKRQEKKMREHKKRND